MFCACSFQEKSFVIIMGKLMQKIRASDINLPVKCKICKITKAISVAKGQVRSFLSYYWNITILAQ